MHFVVAQLANDLIASKLPIDTNNLITTRPTYNWAQGTKAHLRYRNVVYFTGCTSTTVTTLPLCSNALISVNWQSSLGFNVYPALGGGLCPAKDNFFLDSGTFTDDSAFTTQFQIATFAGNVPYGDPIQVLYPTIYFRSNLSVYVADDNQMQEDCNPIDAKPYVVPQVTYSCVDPITGLRIACTGLTTPTVPTLSGGNCAQVEMTITYTSTSSNVTIVGTSVNVVLETKPITNGTNGTSNMYSKSGNPGYLYGAPVLTGKLSSVSNNAIDYIPEPQLGITLLKETPSAGVMQCPSLTDYKNRIPLTFGDNVVTGCTLYLKRSDFDSCTALRQQIYNLQTLTASGITHVGKFGNANVNNVYDWIPVISNPPDLLSTVGDGYSTCAGIVTSFDVEILYSYYGAAAKPQPAIVGIKYSYTTGTYRWFCENPSYCVDPNTYTSGSSAMGNIGTVTKPFQIRSSISFVKVSNVASKLFVPPAPQLINPIPNDVWYPFNIPT
ncbi:hypothetical protein EDD86DRAFT_245973 [Gorgonomyces haynaldii]|nr:hypothetical protein EDD86DRAFT_245973 [Gorgonomyces haynaldii]